MDTDTGVQPSPPISDEDQPEPSRMTRSRRNTRGVPSRAMPEARDTDDDDDVAMEGDRERMEDDDGDASDRFSELAINTAREKENREKGTSDTDEDDEEEVESEEESAAGNSSYTSDTPLSNKDRKINVGDEFQAEIPSICEDLEERAKEKDRDQQIWDCNAQVDESDLDNFLLYATGRWTVPIDRALYILTKCSYDCVKAEEECSKRRQLRERWTKAEKNLFQQAIHMFPKDFKKIQTAMPQRSLGSIVQFYYDTKHQMEYKKYFVEDDGTQDPYFTVMDETKKKERYEESGVCENCAKPAEILIFNRTLYRNECKPCIMFFRIMHRPRPVELSRQEKLTRTMDICPEFYCSDMRMYIRGTHELMELADGKAQERLGLECAPSEEPSDDGIEVLNVNPADLPSGPYLAIGLEPDEVVDEDTCRMTRAFSVETMEMLERRIRKRLGVPVSLVWRAKETKCFEEIKLIKAQAQNLLTTAYSTYDKIRMAHVKLLKDQIAEVRGRCGYNFFEPTEDVPESTGAASRSGKVRCDTNWTNREKKDCIRCFHWYNTDFKTVSDVLGTKTPEQVEEFYMKYKEIIDKSIEAYKKEVSEKNGV